MKERKLIALCAVWLPISYAAILLFKPPYLANILLVYIPVVALLLHHAKESRRRILIFSIVTVVLFAPAVELTARLANIWDVQSDFPRMLGLIPFENMVYAFFNFILGASLTEILIVNKPSATISNRFKWLILLYLLLAVVTYSLFSINPELITFSYPVIGLIFLAIPAAMILVTNKKYLNTLWLPVILLGITFFTHEVVSLHVGHWWWPSKYIYQVSIGRVAIPIEDIVIWHILSGIALVSGYRFFVTD